METPVASRLGAVPRAQPVIKHTLTLMSSKDSPGLPLARAGEWRQAACGQRKAEASLGVQHEADSSVCRGRAPSSTGRAGNGPASQAALPSTQRQQQQPRGARTSWSWDLTATTLCAHLHTRLPLCLFHRLHCQPCSRQSCNSRFNIRYL